MKIPRAPAPLVATLLALLVAVPACQRDLPPDAAYRALVRAMADRDEEAAWDLLSAETRKRLADRARIAAAAAPGVVPADPRVLLAGDAPLAVLPPTSITVLKTDGTRAVLRVEAPGAPTREVELSRERGGWRVTLPLQ
ncbi:MAG: hypothetical protein RJA59_1005 [Pseudomonadota bacterium]